jgi:uncharacterized protein (UPF0303 family)
VSEVEELIAVLEAQERELQFERMDHDLAWELGAHLRSSAARAGYGIVIDVALGEQDVFRAALPGTTAHNDKWIDRKKRTVREWGTSTYLAGLRFPLYNPPFSLETAPWVDGQLYSGSGGGFPLIVSGAGMVGTIAVSGLPPELDHAFIVESLRDFLRPPVAQ